MKKRVKIILIIITVISCLFLGVHSLNQPLAVSTAHIEPRTAELYFTEKGLVLAQRQVEVFSELSGEIVRLNVEEGQSINQGDVICKVDDTEYEYEIKQRENEIKGHQAQISGLSSDEQKHDEQLEANLRVLVGEMNALDAQQSATGFSIEQQVRLQNIIIKQYEDELSRAQENVEKSERLQNIIINQNRDDVQKAKENAEKIQQLQSITIAQNKTDLQNAERDFERSKTLYESGAISKQEYEQAERAVQDAQTILDRNKTLAQQDYDQAVKAVADAETLLSKNEVLAKQDYDQAMAAVQQSQAAVQQSKQQLHVIESGNGTTDDSYFQAMKQSLVSQIEGLKSELDKNYTQDTAKYYASLIEGNNIVIERLKQKIEDTSIKSPIDGIVSKLNVKDTNVINPQMAVAVITNDKECEVEVYVSVMDIETVEIGKQVSVTLKGRVEDKQIPGTVTYIENYAVAKMSALGIEERKVKVIVTPEQPEQLKDGYDVNVKFDILRQHDKFTVPKTAFFKVNDKDVLWVIQNGRAVMTEVVKGAELRAEFIVESGLNVGDVVIVDAGVSGLREGVKVKSE